MTTEKFHKFKKDDVDQFMDNNIYLPTRTIYMGSADDLDGDETGVDYRMAERVIKGLHILDSQAPTGDKPITIIMNNVGGDVVHGMAIYDAIRVCKNHVTIKVFGHAMSMGSVILLAADRRVMSPNSRIMIHYGSTFADGHAKVTYKSIDENKKGDRLVENIYMEKMSGKSITLEDYLTIIGKKDQIPNGSSKQKLVTIGKKELEEMLNFDTYIDAEIALQLGLIDEIMSS